MLVMLRTSRLRAICSAGSQEHLLDVDSDMDGPMPNSRQRMIPPDVQGDSDEAVSRPTLELHANC